MGEELEGIRLASSTPPAELPTHHHDLGTSPPLFLAWLSFVWWWKMYSRVLIRLQLHDVNKFLITPYTYVSIMSHLSSMCIWFT
jgi:hypothetical protein